MADHYLTQTRKREYSKNMSLYFFLAEILDFLQKKKKTLKKQVSTHKVYKLQLISQHFPSNHIFV